MNQQQTGADKTLPTFVKARIDHAVRVGILDRDSKRVNVLAAISSSAADQYIDAAVQYLVTR